MNEPIRSLKIWEGRGEDKTLNLPDVATLTARTDNVVAVLYFPMLLDGYEVVLDAEHTQKALSDWLEGKFKTLVVRGADRIELYELPARR